jgi:hypothetical protein
MRESFWKEGSLGLGQQASGVAAAMGSGSKGQGHTFAPLPQALDAQCVKRSAKSAKDP